MGAFALVCSASSSDNVFEKLTSKKPLLAADVSLKSSKGGGVLLPLTDSTVPGTFCAEGCWVPCAGALPGAVVSAFDPALSCVSAKGTSWSVALGASVWLNQPHLPSEKFVLSLPSSFVLYVTAEKDRLVGLAISAPFQKMPPLKDIFSLLAPEAVLMLVALKEVGSTRVCRRDSLSYLRPHPGASRQLIIARRCLAASLATGHCHLAALAGRGPCIIWINGSL